MRIVQKSKRMFAALLTSALCFGAVAGVTAPARAAEILPQETYVGETRSSTCTLLSSTMLIRSTLYLNGSSHWNEVDEFDVESVAWLSGAGLLFSWSFQTDYAAIDVNQTALNGVSETELKALLDAHPEGIVFYCGEAPHAVFLTDYEGDTFYCADPAAYIAGSRIPLADSWLGDCYDFDQATILANATAYWAVTSCEVKADVQPTPLETLALSGDAEAVEDAAQAEPESAPVQTLSPVQQLMAEADMILAKLKQASSEIE